MLSTVQVNVRYPDFKHKTTQKGLWVKDSSNPTWVEAKLAAMPPGTVQLNIFAWNRRIARYVRAGQYEKAMELFQQMQREGMIPNSFTFVQVINVCASTAALEEGKRVHQQIVQNCYESDVFVGTSLVDMYAKCGRTEDAWMVFSKMPTRNVVSWNAMILGYAKCGQGTKALELARQMQLEGVQPVPMTFVGLLNACAGVGALEQGRLIHEQIIQSGCESDVFVGSCLVDMYAKCGSIEDAKCVFNKMSTCSVVSWSAMLGGFAMHGDGKEALGYFKWMCEEGVQVDRVTFISLLSACTHAGLVEEGLHYFESMSLVYSISADVEHYGCMVDLLGRAGRLHEAEDLINKMHCGSNATVWMTLLGSCRLHGNVELGECIAKIAIEHDPGNAAAYVLLSDMYAAASNWDSSANIQLEMLERDVKEQMGCTWIEVNSEVHSFTTDDQEHP